MRRQAIGAFAAIALTAVPAQAELVFFATGRSLSVKGHHFEGEALVLALRGGGDMICEASVVVRIEPDEVPYPEPAPDVTAVLQAVAVARADVLAALRLEPDPRYEPLIRRVAAAHGVDARLVSAVIQVESAFQQQARSRKGAVGLMQVMPATARRYGVFNLYDPTSNLEAGIRHLKALLGRFPVSLALAAYNAGEATVERFGGIPPYPETQEYVSRVLRLLAS